MAPVTCDTQAYFNILFQNLQNLSALLFAIFEVPRIAWGGGEGECKQSALWSVRR